jgi:hypothetical protein
VGAQRLVAPCQILGRVAIEIAERCRQAVATVLGRCATKRPERILQPLGESDETFSAQHAMSVLPAGEGEAKVIEPVIEPLAGDADAKLAHVGEVG